jgi:KRAB domain-containing zinc finger protein
VHEKDYNPTPGDIVFLNREYVLDGQNNVDSVNSVPAIDFPESPLASEEPKSSSSPRKNKKGEKIYSCKMCPFRSDNVNTYSYHKKLHCIQARYSCSECSYSINNITSLNEHIKLHKKEKEMIRLSLTERSSGVKHRCPKCPYSSPNKNLLVAHTSMHSSGREYACTKCDYSSDRQALLQLHLKVHNDSYSDSDSLEEMEMLMKRSSDVIGPQIFLTSSSTNDLDSDSSDGNDTDHKCEKCPFSTPSKDELGNHLQQHETPGKSRCMYCSYSCSKEDDLVSHVQVHFPGTPVDREMLRSLRRQSNTHKRNIVKAFNEDSGDAAENQTAGEPDSTVNETPKKESSESEEPNPQKQDVVKETEKTKVYVCQFCEREFDCKSTMIQHEKQHLY